MFHPRKIIGAWIYRRFLSAELRRRRWLKNTPADQLGPEFLGTADLLHLVAGAGPPPRQIWDVGANRGHWATLARSFFPEASIVCFEPLESQLDTLAAVCAKLGGARHFPYAAGARAETTTFYETEYGDCSSLLAPLPAGKFADALKIRRQTSVAVRRLDEIQRTHALAAPDLIKCDIQGSELDALRGAAGVLPSVRWLLIEAQFVPAYQNAGRPADLVAFLDSQGFDLVGLERDTEPWQPLYQADLLFQKRLGDSPAKNPLPV